jgi:predicted TIM-barrel fold metal-dependent hydrolase
MSHQDATAGTERRGDGLVVDADVHQTRASDDEIERHLPPRYATTGLELPGRMYNNPGSVLRRDAGTAEGGPAGSTPENLRTNLLEAFDVDYAVLTGDMLSLSVLPNRDYAAELARAYNELVLEKWLPADERLLGSVLVAPQHPERAAELIREYGTEDRMVQVLMNSVSRGGYGEPRYRPIFEAAVEVGLPVALHPSNQGAGMSEPPNAVGYPSNYFARHNAMPMLHMGQLNSLLSEGVFAALPDLRVVFVECGFTWLPGFLWRVDKDWKGLRAQVPWLERPPSEYVLEQTYYTTQPVPEPETPEQFRQMLSMAHADRTLLFSSDYPHWDNDDPRVALPSMPESTERRVLSGNAADLYELPG